MFKIKPHDMQITYQLGPYETTQLAPAYQRTGDFALLNVPLSVYNRALELSGGQRARDIASAKKALGKTLGRCDDNPEFSGISPFAQAIAEHISANGAIEVADTITLLLHNRNAGRRQRHLLFIMLSLLMLGGLYYILTPNDYDECRHHVERCDLYYDQQNARDLTVPPSPNDAVSADLKNTKSGVSDHILNQGKSR